MWDLRLWARQLCSYNTECMNASLPHFGIFPERVIVQLVSADYSNRAGGFHKMGHVRNMYPSSRMSLLGC